jgi:hypothetical protein
VEKNLNIPINNSDTPVYKKYIQTHLRIAKANERELTCWVTKIQIISQTIQPYYVNAMCMTRSPTNRTNLSNEAICLDFFVVVVVFVARVPLLMVSDP